MLGRHSEVQPKRLLDRNEIATHAPTAMEDWPLVFSRKASQLVVVLVRPMRAPGNIRIMIAIGLTALGSALVGLSAGLAQFLSPGGFSPIYYWVDLMFLPRVFRSASLFVVGVVVLTFGIALVYGRRDAKSTAKDGPGTAKGAP